MRSDVFARWLKDLESDMCKKDRQIALLIDSAPSHSTAEKTKLSSITIIRLPPNTTSLTQPLDTGIIRSFKAYYSKEMLQTIARTPRKANGAISSVQNAKLWSHFESSWRKVTPGCIRNCFVKVPIMCRSHADELKKTGVENVREQVEELQKELASKYQHLDEAIRSQTDIGVLNYIDMINCDGPDETTMVAIKETIETDAFQDIFIHEEQEESGDEDDEETEDEEDDLDFEPNSDLSAAVGYELGSDDGLANEDSLVLRSNTSYPQPDHHASPPSSPMYDDCADLLNGGSSFLATFHRIGTLARTVSHDNHAAISRLRDLQRAAESTLDFLSLQCSQSSTELPSDPTVEVLQSEVTAATDEEGELEVEDEVDDYVEEEEEERLHRTHHIR